VQDTEHFRARLVQPALGDGDALDVKNNFLFFIGVFAALLISWLGIVVGSNAQLGSLPPYYDDNAGGTFPEWMPGIAAEGQLVYRDLGCVACHTQQVRRPGFGSDTARGWGDRQSVARDYIYQPFPQIGSSRVGPDLTNLGDRKVPYDSDDLLNMLYSGSQGMPSYRFLFESRQVGKNAQVSDKALKLTGGLKPEAGWEIVPTRRAVALVGYLVNLKTSFTYPEAAPFTPPKPEGEAAKPAAAPGAVPAPTAPAPAPAAGNPSTPAATAAPAPGAAAAPAAPAPAPASTGPTPPTTPAPSGAATPAPGAAATPAPSTTPAPNAAAAPAPAATNPSTPAAPTTPAPGAAATPAPSTAAAPAPAATGQSPSTTPAPSGAATPAPAPSPAPGAGAAPSPTPATTPAPSKAGGTQ
jgi:cytochrome c oxidase cbb3-type subunit 2